MKPARLLALVLVLLAAVAGSRLLPHRGDVGVLPATYPASCHTRAGLPDPACTPGAVDPAVTQANLRRTICRPGGYTDSVRPPTSYTNALKRAQLARYHLDLPAAAVEEDHLIPLALGGAPRSPANLWPQPWTGAAGARAKDRVELALHDAVCADRILLTTARHAIANNWPDAMNNARNHP